MKATSLYELLSNTHSGCYHARRVREAVTFTPLLPIYTWVEQGSGILCLAQEHTSPPVAGFEPTTSRSSVVRADHRAIELKGLILQSYIEGLHMSSSWKIHLYGFSDHRRCRSASASVQYDRDWCAGWSEPLLSLGVIKISLSTAQNCSFQNHKIGIFSLSYYRINPLSANHDWQMTFSKPVFHIFQRK